MKFKDFKRWCYERLEDGYLDQDTANSCFALIDDIYACPFWKRRKMWKEVEINIVENVVIPINFERRFDAIRKVKESEQIQ